MRIIRLALALTIGIGMAAQAETVITARGQHNPEQGFLNAFDGDIYTKWLDSENPTWIQIQYDTTNTVAQYAITSADDEQGRDPKDFTLLGSNDGATWVEVDTRTNVVFSARHEQLVFTLSTPVAYSAYRLEVDAVFDGGGGLMQLAEIEFFSEVPPPPTLLADPVGATASSEYPGYVVTRLYDGTVGAGDIGTSDNLGLDYAGQGQGPHVVVYDMGASVTFNAVVYAQRITDFVGEIEFWVTDTDPGAAATDMSILNDGKISVVTVANVTNDELTMYELGGSTSGRYVVMRLNPVDGGNPGGSELVLAFGANLPTNSLVPASSAVIVLADPVGATASSEFNDFYAVTNLYDATVGADNIGSGSNLGNQYAGIGSGPHVVVYDMGASVTFNAVVYSQRAGYSPNQDKVAGIEFWVTDTDPGAATNNMVILDTVPDAVVTVSNVTDHKLTVYGLGGVVSGQYVVMRLTAAGGGNPGGTELVLALDEYITYEAWARDNGLFGGDADENTDVEPDGLNNLMEFALGGNPKINDAAAVAPHLFVAGEAGTNWFYYVHNQRTDNADLVYTVGSTADLILGSYDTNDVSVVGETPEHGGFKTVTNRTEATSGVKFIKLEIEL